MNGIVLLDKPCGITSFKATRAVAGIYGEKKAGHAGTLDPMATGVLPVLLGTSTRLADYVVSETKAYRATMKLGTVTDTYDITGATLETRPVDADTAKFAEVLERFRGAIEQIPPVYSAVKHNGKPLYRLARAGVEADIKPRKIIIYELRMCGCPAENEYTIEVRCSKGTYIRSLVNDIGRELGCGAVLTGLRRTAAGRFTVSDCHTLEEIKSYGGRCVLSPVAAIERMPAVYVSEKQAARFTHGGELDIERLSGDPPRDVPLRVMLGGALLGIAVACDGGGSLCPRCVLERVGDEAVSS